MEVRGGEVRRVRKLSSVTGFKCTFLFLTLRAAGALWSLKGIVPFTVLSSSSYS